MFGFDPQALTSLTYEDFQGLGASKSFDPQALTSLTGDTNNWTDTKVVSIHRLLRA